jgi:hypothetical protein
MTMRSSCAPSRVGIRLSLYSQIFDMPTYEQTEKTYFYLTAEISKRNFSCIHLNDERRQRIRLFGRLSREVPGSLFGNSHPAQWP